MVSTIEQEENTVRFEITDNIAWQASRRGLTRLDAIAIKCAALGLFFVLPVNLG
jgi:hypothetical protein